MGDRRKEGRRPCGRDHVQSVRSCCASCACLIPCAVSAAGSGKPERFLCLLAVRADRNTTRLAGYVYGDDH